MISWLIHGDCRWWNSIRIDSIRDLVELDSLEQIKHFYFPPWERDTPYRVIVSSSTKEEEAKNHIEYLQTICNNKIKTIYTDGSETPKGIGVGLGFAAFNNSQPYIPTIPFFEFKENIGPSTIVYNGELEGIAKAIEYANKIC